MKIRPLQIISIFIIVIGYLLLFYTFFAYYAFDDLGFDFAGYSLRYNFAFDWWNNQLLQGIPTSLFDPFVPSILPLALKFFGFGNNTLPIAISIFLLRTAIPVAFYFLGKKLGTSAHASILAGVLFVLNPFTYRFLNRYYELAAWLFFICAFYFFISAINEKKLFTKNFLFTSIFSSLVALSHLSVIIFLVPCFLFFSQSKDELKKTLVILFAAFLLGSFWFSPFLYYQTYSSVGQQKGYLLSTQGIFSANLALLALLLITVIALFLVFRKNRFMQVSEAKRFLIFSGAVLVFGTFKFIFPWFPVISIPFTHSFNVFYVFTALVAWLYLSSVKLFSQKHFLALFFIFLLFFLAGFSRFSPLYFFEEPRLSTYKQLNGFEFEKVAELLEKIPPYHRYETIPYDPVVSAYSSINNQKILNLLGYGYDPYTINKSYDGGLSIVSMKISCSEFTKSAQNTATSYFVALTLEAKNYLSSCGMKKFSGEIPSLFSTENPGSIIENGDILSIERNSILAKVNPPATTIKINNFPKLVAKNTSGEKVEIAGEKWVKIQTASEQTIRITLEPNPIERASLLLSVFWAGALLFFCNKKD